MQCIRNRPCTPGNPYHPLRPFVHDLDQTKLQRSELFPRDFVGLLYPFYTLRNRGDGVHTLFDLRRDHRLDFGLFLEDETGQERNDLLGIVPTERVFQNELCENELIRRVNLMNCYYPRKKCRNGNFTYLAGDAPFEKDGRVLVNELEIFEDVHSLLVVWNQLEILIRDLHFEMSDVRM